MHDYPGNLIVFDGPDGCGKSTQCNRAISYLESRGRTVHHFREPGGTPIGEAVRNILLDNRYEEMTLRTELLLYQAPRAQLVETKIIPVLKKDEDVVLDRFILASFAYQIIAGGLPREEAMSIIAFSTQGLKADLTFLLNLAAEVGIARCRKGGVLDRMEQKALDFHRKVRSGYLQYADLYPENTVVIDASRTIEEIETDVRKVLEERLFI